MQKPNRLQRLLAVLVAVFMAVCCLPLSAFAEGEAETYIFDQKSYTFNVKYVGPDGNEVILDSAPKTWTCECDDLRFPVEYSVFELNSDQYELADSQATFTPEDNGEWECCLLWCKFKPGTITVPVNPIEKTITVNFKLSEDAEPYKTVELSSANPNAANVAENVVTTGLNFEKWLCSDLNRELEAGAIFCYNDYKDLVTFDDNHNATITYVAQYGQPAQVYVHWRIQDDGKGLNSFADNNEQELDEIISLEDASEIPVKKLELGEGYTLTGWTVSGKDENFVGFGSDAATLNAKVEGVLIEEENGNYSVYIFANIKAPEQKPDQGGNDGNNDNNDNSNGSNNTTTTTTVTSSAGTNTTQTTDQTTSAAESTVKAIPQTGLMASAPVVFVVMLVAALAGAGAYLFALRKKLN